MHGALLAVLVVMGGALPVGPDPTGLIEQLGSPRFAQRESAELALGRMGRLALPALRGALDHKDPEVRTRSAAIVRRIEGGLLVEPTMLTLDFVDIPLTDALATLNRQSGLKLTMTPRSLRVLVESPSFGPVQWVAPVLEGGRPVVRGGTTPLRLRRPERLRAWRLDLRPLRRVRIKPGDVPRPRPVPGPVNQSPLPERGSPLDRTSGASNVGTRGYGPGRPVEVAQPVEQTILPPDARRRRASPVRRPRRPGEGSRSDRRPGAVVADPRPRPRSSTDIPATSVSTRPPWSTRGSTSPIPKGRPPD